jgi:dihydrodipicolinate synthase/N-acetylneuraminate lyase
MQRPSFSYICRNVTTFNGKGEFDESAFGRFLERFIQPRIGFYVASSGSGLGQALHKDDLARIYRTAVAVGKGKVQVGANIPEQYTSRLSIEHAKLAADANVDIINIYGPDGRHGFRPTDDEYRIYFDRILAEIKYPISLCPNPTLGYLPKPSVIAGIANTHTQVQNVILTGIKGDDLYFFNLMNALKRDVDVYVTESGSLNMLSMGAAGLAGNLANFIPSTYRSYLDLVAASRIEEAGVVYARIRQLMQYVAQWTGGAPRWHLMFMKAFKLPGGDGKLPDPYLGYGDAEVARFAKGILEFNVPEISEMARTAGLAL